MQKMVHETKKVFGDKDKKKKIEGKNQINEIQSDIRDGINFDINKEFVSNNQQYESEDKQNNDVINFNTTDVIPVSSNNNTNNNTNFPYILERTNQNEDFITFDNDVTNPITMPPQQTQPTQQQTIDNFFSTINSQSPLETTNKT